MAFLFRIGCILLIFRLYLGLDFTFKCFWTVVRFGLRIENAGLDHET